MAPDKNIDRDYDEVIKLLEGYRLFEKQMASKAAHLPWTHPKRYFKALKQLPSGLRQLDILSGKSHQFTLDIVTDIATDDEKASEYFPIFASDYPLHDLSLFLETSFPDVDFEQMKQLHESKEKRLSWLGVKGSVAIILATATALLKSIPESVVARVVDYKQFELVTSIAAALAILYLLLLLLPFHIVYSRAKKIHTFARQVIDYTCIRHAKRTSQVGH